MKLADKPLLTCLVVNAIIKNNSISSVESFNAADNKIDAILIKTGWVAKKLADGQFDLNGSDPPSITVELIDKLFDSWLDLKILMVDLPTIDPESDRGKLLAHRRFFARNGMAIVELLNADARVQPGLYLVSINMSVFESDASPCSPIIYPVKSK